MRRAVATCLAMLLFAAVSAHTDAAGRHPLPKGYHWGRCLLVVAGITRISGKCAYEFREHGGFYIAGRRQIYEGIDYQNPDHSGVGQRSSDYWFVVSRNDDGSWFGYGNDTVGATHGGPEYGPITRHGACFVGAIDLGESVGSEEICLWRTG
jgi:hypothetical protein